MLCFIRVYACLLLRSVIYWVDGGKLISSIDRKIGRVNYDGSGADTLRDRVGHVDHITLDLVKNILYWTAGGSAYVSPCCYTTII